LRVFKNRALRSIFGPKREVVTSNKRGRKLHKNFIVCILLQGTPVEFTYRSCIYGMVKTFDKLSNKQTPWSRFLLEKNTHSATEEISGLLLNWKIRYCVHESLPLDLILNHMNPVHALLPCLIHCNIILPSMPRFPGGFLPSYFLTKLLYTFLISFMHTTCPKHLYLQVK